jgi:Flp pilus assembly protein TadG
MLRSIANVRRWLLEESDEPRRAPRLIQPEIVVHYWDGAAPEGREIRDISESGAFILTRERWYPGTIIRLVLQGYPDTAREGEGSVPTASICIPARVVRPGDDGVAIEFVFGGKREQNDFRAFLATIPAQSANLLSANATNRRSGQALVELALITPLVFLLAVNALNFGGFIFAWITVANAARAGVQYMVMSSASPENPTPATAAQITALITSDVSSLLNRSSVVVATCTNNSTSANGCTTLFDPEAPAYTLATVDVTYTYQPFIPLFSFPKVGISATLPTSTIHRKAVMRMLQ